LLPEYGGADPALPAAAGSGTRPGQQINHKLQSSRRSHAAMAERLTKIPNKPPRQKDLLSSQLVNLCPLVASFEISVYARRICDLEFEIWELFVI